MIYFISLLCSLCIQFGAVGITPFDYSVWDNTGSPVYTGLEFLETLTNIDLSEFYYSYLSTSDGYGFCYVPLSYFSDGYDDISISYDYYIVDDNGYVIGYRVTMSNVRSYSWNSNGSFYYNDYVYPSVQIVDVYFRGYQPPNYNGWLVERLNVSYMPYILNNIVFVYNGVVPDDDLLNLSSIGAMDINGHSSGGSPLEILGGVTWSSMSGHSSGGTVGPSPHSSSTHFNTTTQNPDANDSKTDNLLYMLGNKLADITENTSAITSALGGVMYNVMEGASAIFNGISVFNDNVVNFASYLTTVPTSQDISSALDQCENISALRDLSETINIWEDLGLTQVNSAPTYTFNFNGTMFDSMGNFTLNFNFLDSTKNLWQPLFIALLYFNLLVTILTGLPDLVQGRGET